jgi:hypothetical protein
MSAAGPRIPFAPTAIDRGVARAVLLGTLPASAQEPERSDAVARFTATRIRSCPAPMRAGVRLVGMALACVAFTTRRVRVDAAPAVDVERALRPWLGLPLRWYDGIGEADARAAMRGAAGAPVGGARP